jgi:hypothetical protein
MISLIALECFRESRRGEKVVYQTISRGIIYVTPKTLLSAVCGYSMNGVATKKKILQGSRG